MYNITKRHQIEFNNSNRNRKIIMFVCVLKFVLAATSWHYQCEGIHAILYVLGVLNKQEVKRGSRLHFCRKKNKSQKGEISIRITLRKFLPNILSEERFFCIDLGYEVLSTVRNLQKPKALVPKGLCLCCRLACLAFCRIWTFLVLHGWWQSSGLVSYLFRIEAMKKPVLYFICHHMY